MIKNIETCFNYCSLDEAYFSSNEWHWITKIHKLKEQYPELVTVLAEPADNNGCIYVRMPVKFLQLRGPQKKRELTDEQRERIAEHMRNIRPQR